MYGLYRLTTLMGTVVKSTVDGVRHFDRCAFAEDHRDLIAVVPCAQPRLCFLLIDAEPRRDVVFVGDPWSAPVLSMRLRAIPGSDAVAIVHPHGGRFLSADIKDLGQSGAIDMMSDRREFGEAFRLEPVTDGDALRDRLPLIGLIETMSATLSHTEDFVAALGADLDPLSKTALGAFARLLTQEQLLSLGRRLVVRPALLSRLETLFPNDMWLASAARLLDLAVRRKARRPEPIRLTLPDLDRLASAGHDGQFATFGHGLTHALRTTIEPTRGVCVVAVARNEGLYLLEWLAYHRSIGVEHFFIYTNDNDDGSAELLEALADAGVVTLMHNQLGAGVSPQHKAYGHALQILPDILCFEWALFIDLDEFFCFDPRAFASIADFIAWRHRPDSDAIAFNWLVFASGGQTRLTREPLIKRFRRRMEAVDVHVKSMCRPHRFMHAFAHFPVAPLGSRIAFRRPDGEPHVPRMTADPGSAYACSTQPSADLAWINHYFYKSAVEFLWKRTRPGGVASVRIVATTERLDRRTCELFLAQHDSVHHVDDDRILRCSPGLIGQMLKLLDLPGVRQAHEAVEDMFHARTATLIDLLDDEPRFGVVGSPEYRFRRMIDEAVAEPVRHPRRGTPTEAAAMG